MELGSCWDHVVVSLGSCCGQFGVMLGSVWGHVEVSLGSCWGHFGDHVEVISVHLGNIVGSFCGKFRIMLGHCGTDSDRFGVVFACRGLSKTFPQRELANAILPYALLKFAPSHGVGIGVISIGFR